MKRGSCHRQIFTGMCKNVCILINVTVNTYQIIDMSERPSNHSVSGFNMYYLHSFTVNTGQTDHQSILITSHCFLCEATSVLKSMILTKLQLPFYFSSVWDGGRWKEKEEDRKKENETQTERVWGSIQLNIKPQMSVRPLQTDRLHSARNKKGFLAQKEVPLSLSLPAFLCICSV